LVRYSGVLEESRNQRIALRFAIFATATGSSPLWSELQTVDVDAEGKYSVLLGAASGIGMPATVFAAGEARWLSVQRSENGANSSPTELPRIPLASVPYAMKAADAQTLAGQPAGEFVTRVQLTALLAAQLPGQQSVSAPMTTTPPAVVGTGVVKYVPMWTNSNQLSDSILYQAVSGTSPRIGVNTTSPLSTFDINGSSTVRGELNLPSAASTAKTGANSPLLELSASSYNSSSNLPVAQKFGWMATAAANDTASPSANLSLYYGQGTASPTATGLSISPQGVITFAPAQTFPSSGSGGAVNASSYDLNGTRFDYGNESNAFLAYAGNGGQGTGTSNLGIGESSMTSLTSGSANVSLGFATLANDSTGSGNTALGAQVLQFNQAGNNNTAIGGGAMALNSSGNSNTAVGVRALSYNTIGGSNTAIGASAGPDPGSTALTNATAIGANATVSVNNALVLGQTTVGSPGASHVNVGVGTATPVSTMELSVNVPDGMGPVLTLTNGGGTTGAPGYHPATTAIDFKTYLHSSTLNSPTSRIEAQDDDYGNLLSFYTKNYGSDSAALIDQVDIGITYAMNVNGYLNVCCDSGISSDPPTIADFGGSIEVDGNVNATTLVVREDHPLDPANKFLEQSAVASSEQMNLYSGNVTTDELGIATVKLPEWFEAENSDFRYQLTTIGRNAHAWVAEEVESHKFKIATDAAFVKVSWQITAVRQSAYAKAHPTVVERQKSSAERGYYLHPDLYGQPEEKQTRWGRHPRELLRRKARQAAQAAASRSNTPVAEVK
jgi:hypothetical protein